MKEEEYFRRQSEQEAIKSLYRSLIVRALRDYVTYKSAKKSGGKKLFAEAKKWIFNGYSVESFENFSPNKITLPSEDNELHELDRLMSFESICAILGWDANLVRRRIKVLTQEDLDRIGPNLMDL